MMTSIGLWLFDGLILHVYDTDIPLCVLLRHFSYLMVLVDCVPVFVGLFSLTYSPLLLKEFRLLPTHSPPRFLATTTTTSC